MRDHLDVGDDDWDCRSDGLATGPLLNVMIVSLFLLVGRRREPACDGRTPVQPVGNASLRVATFLGKAR
jgi:hypothetical protein